jgi:excisionase family DNA binding protein
MKELLTKREIASLLKISLNTLNFWICERKIPFLKLGTGKNASVRFSREEIERWLKNMKGEN